jgi:hypothetical protein
MTRKITWGLAIISVIFIGFLIYWFVPLQTCTYSSPAGQNIFSIKYPLRFSKTCVKSGEYLDVGKSNEVSDMGILIHFIYSGTSTFGNDVSYSTVTNCADLEKNDPYQGTPMFVKGYTSKKINNKTICYLTNDQNLDSINTRAQIILNPSPIGVLSVLYPKKDKFQAELMLNTIQTY